VNTSRPILRHRMTRRAALRLLALATGGGAVALATPTLATAASRPRVTPAARVRPAAPPAPAAAPALAPDASPAFTAVAAALADTLSRYEVPGAALGILMDGREEHAVFGAASLNTLEPATPETRFQVGSLTKTFTATAAWRLIERGSLGLDAPVRAFVPGFQVMDEDVSRRVTVRHLLTHTSGWFGDALYETSEGEDALARYVAEKMPLLPQVSPLGRFVSYNNSGFILLGHLVELAAGKPYRAAIQELVLEPLSLGSSTFDHALALSGPHADGHTAGPINGRDVVTVQTPLFVPRSGDPAGGLWSTTRDILRYARFHLGDGTAGGARTLARASLAAMQAPAAPILGLATLSIGMNWIVQDVGGVHLISHAGDTPGQHTEVWMIPERGFALVLLANSQPGGPPAGQAMLDEALRQYPGLGALAGTAGVQRVLLAPADGSPPRPSPERLDEYAGRYGNVLYTLTFATTDGALQMTLEPHDPPWRWRPAIQAPPSPAPVPVTFAAEDVAFAGGRLPFLRDADGHVRWVANGLRLIARLEDA